MKTRTYSRTFYAVGGTLQIYGAALKNYEKIHRKVIRPESLF